MRSRDFSTWMWSEALTLLEQADRLQRQFFRPPTGEAHVWEPPVDIVETATEVRLHVALPGVAAESIALNFEPQAITVRAVRDFPAREEDARIHALEIPYGRFERRIALPIQALSLVGQDLRNGCLTLIFARKESE